ncbi:MAG: M23 family metallopeptidase [Clostridia bacterium]|nr:M23 family metallopeptidase [Clostridia bacterium]
MRAFGGGFYVTDTPSELLAARVVQAGKSTGRSGAHGRLPARLDGLLAAIICTAMLGAAFLCASPVISMRGGIGDAVSAVGRFIVSCTPVSSLVEAAPANTEPQESGAVLSDGDVPMISYISHPSAEAYIASPPELHTEFYGIMPASGEIISDFSYRDNPLYGAGEYGMWEFHKGIDIPLAEGSEVRAFADGTVKETGESPSYGIYIVMTHADGFESVYAHLSEAVRGVGAKVKQGDTIGYSGKTGRVTGPHLHFELHRDGVPVDPEDYIK